MSNDEKIISDKKIIHELSMAIINMLEHYTDSDIKGNIYDDGLSCNEIAVEILWRIGIIYSERHNGIWHNRVNRKKLEEFNKS